MPVGFVVDDAGRSKSKRAKQKNDCAVRSLAIVAQIPYDEAYELLAKHVGRKSGHGVETKPWKKFIENTVINGYKFRWISFPAEAGKPRMTAESFAMTEYSQRAIVRNPGHFYASIDGFVHEDRIGNFNSKKCVYGCWVAERVSA